MAEDDGENLIIKKYFEVCNTAIDLNKDRFPFKQILAAAVLYETAQNIEMCIVDNKIIKKYILSLKNEVITATKQNSSNMHNCIRSWNVEKQYLQSVIDNPGIYIENPALLDWSWMYSGSSS